MSKKFKNSVDLLKEYGLKQTLINKLNSTQNNELAQFALNHTLTPKISIMLTQLASMELSGKEGAAYLACYEIATIMQVKSLTIKQVDEISEDHKFHHNLNLAIRHVKQSIIENQQAKLNDRIYDKIDVTDTGFYDENSEILNKIY